MKFEVREVSTTIDGKYPLLKKFIYDFEKNILSIKIFHNKLNDIDLFNEENYLDYNCSENIYKLENYDNTISYGLLRLTLVYAPFFKEDYCTSKYRSNYTEKDVINYLKNIGDDKLKYIFEALFMQKNDMLVAGVEYGNFKENYDIDSVINSIKNVNINLYKEMIMEYKLKRG